MFFSKGVSLKWMSIAWAPARKSAKFSNPIIQAMETPTEDQREYLPPTQSHILNRFSGGIPNFITSSSFSEIATKWCPIEASFLTRSRNHLLAVRAFVMVSWVVKVLEVMRKRVVSGEIFLSVSPIWAPSTFDTKWGWRRGFQ